MFIQDKEKQEQRIGYKEKGKVLQDLYKGKSLALKVLIGLQELTLHEFMYMSSLYLDIKK